MAHAVRSVSTGILCAVVVAASSLPARADDSGTDAEPNPNAESEQSRSSDGEDDPASAGAIEVPTVDVESEAPKSGEESGGTRRRTEISAEELERRGIDTLGEALESISASSTSTSSQSSKGAIVEGLPASQLTVLRDGTPVGRKQGSRSGTSVDLSSIPIDPDNIERIELERGVGPAGTGDASGVVVNIVTSSGADRSQVSADGAVAGVPMELATGRGSGYVSTPLGGPWSLRLAGGYTRERALDVNDDGIFDLPSTERWNASTRFAWQPVSDRRLRLRLAANRTDTDVPGDPSGPLFNSVETGDYGVHLTGRWKPTGRWQIEHRSGFGLYRHRFEKVVRETGFERLKADTREFGTEQSVVATHFLKSHDLSFELSGEAQRIVRRGETGTLEPVDLGTIGASVDETWYLSDDWRLNSRVYGDLHSRFGPGWLGRIGAAWEFATDWTLRSAVSRSRRFPTAEEMFLFFDHSEIGYQIEGNPNLSPEITRSARLGVDTRLLDGALEATIEGFYHRLSDLIGTVESSGSEGANGRVATFTYANIARAHTGGVDLGLAGRGVGYGFGFGVNYTYLPLAANRATGERLVLRPRHSGRLEIRRRWGEGDLTTWIRADYRSPMAAGETPAPGYGLGSLGFEWQINRIAAASLGARNVLDQTDPTWGPKPGFNVLAQLHFDWENTNEPD